MSFKLIVISPSTHLKNELRDISALFSAGLKIFHIRKPGLSKSELRDYIQGIPKKYHKRLVIHSHYVLLKEFDLRGIHLPEKNRKKKLPDSFDSKKHHVSASFHAMVDVERNKRKYDYIFLSPVFNSLSKKNYKSAFAKEDLIPFLKAHKNVVALGGIEPGTLLTANILRFKGAATLGFIWESKDPVKAYRQLASKIKQPVL